MSMADASRLLLDVAIFYGDHSPDNLAIMPWTTWGCAALLFPDGLLIALCLRLTRTPLPVSVEKSTTVPLFVPSVIVSTLSPESSGPRAR